MALDLFFGKSKRNWARSQALTTVPPLNVSPTPTKIDDALSRAIAANPGIDMAKPSGKGAIISKKWGWG